MGENPLAQVRALVADTSRIAAPHTYQRAQLTVLLAIHDRLAAPVSAPSTALPSTETPPTAGAAKATRKRTRKPKTTTKG